MSKEPYLRSVTWDKEARAVYVQFGKGRVKQSLERSIQDMPVIITVDVDKDRNLVGVEILL